MSNKEKKVINIRWLRFKKKLKNIFGLFLAKTNDNNFKNRNSQSLHKVI